MSEMRGVATLDGKVALVTGASRGIGRAIAVRLAEEGADIAINYQSSKEQADELANYINATERLDDIEELTRMIELMGTRAQAKEIMERVESMGRHAMVTQANVGSIDEVMRMSREVMDEFGRIDILVNNAGIVRDKSFLKMTPDMWEEVLSVNLTGTFNCTKAVVPGMLERNYGRIANISSVVGRMGNRGQANYAASKAGMIGFTQTLARELANKGVTVNAVAPGFIETDMLRTVPQNLLDNILVQIPVGRLGKPEEVASAVAYLVSADAGYITGQVIDINGGLFIG